MDIRKIIILVSCFFVCCVCNAQEDSTAVVASTPVIDNGAVVSEVKEGGNDVAKPTDTQQAEKKKKGKKEKEPKEPKPVKKDKRAVRDSKIMGQALAHLLHEKQTLADTIAKELSAKYAGSPDVQTEIGRAYFRQGTPEDREKTAMYIRKALELDGNYAPAFKLRGMAYGQWDKEKQEFIMYPEDVDSACYWYDKALLNDPNDVETYKLYADAISWQDMNKAKEMLDKIREIDPNENVDLLLADLFDKGSKRGRTAEEVEARRIQADSIASSLDPRSLDYTRLSTFALNAALNSNYDRSLDLCKIGLEKFPNHKKDFSRIGAWAAAFVPSYNDGLEYAGYYLANASADSIWSIDYFAMGACRLGTGDKDGAFEYFKKASDKQDDRFSPTIAGNIYRQINQQIDAYKKRKRYDDAIALMTEYNEEFPSKSDPAYRLYLISELYNSKVRDIAEDTTKTELLKQYARDLFKVYERIETEYPTWENLSFVYYTHANYTYSFFDKDMSKGLAEPYYRKLYELQVASPETMNLGMLENSIRYMIALNYQVKKDINATHLWARRMLEYFPDSEMAQNLLKLKKIY